MKDIALVAIGGGLGAVARWMLSGAILHHAVAWRFPVGTFAVNTIGCLAAGVLAGLITKHDLFSPAARLFLLTGLLGGFTTFSAFGVECLYLLRRGEYAMMALYALLSVAAALAGLLLAFRLVPAQAHHP
jgi:CrcB protein